MSSQITMVRTLQSTVNDRHKNILIVVLLPQLEHKYIVSEAWWRMTHTMTHDAINLLNHLATEYLQATSLTGHIIHLIRLHYIIYARDMKSSKATEHLQEIDPLTGHIINLIRRCKVSSIYR